MLNYEDNIKRLSRSTCRSTFLLPFLVTTGTAKVPVEATSYYHSLLQLKQQKYLYKQLPIAIPYYN